MLKETIREALTCSLSIFEEKIEVIIIILLELLVKLLEKRLEITEESVVNRLSVSRNGSALKLLISGIHWGARQPEYAKSIVLTFVVRNTSALSGLPLCHSWVVTGVLAMKKWSLVYPGPKSKMYFLPMVVTANIPFWIDLIFRLLSWNQVDVLQFLIFNDVLEVDDQANLRNILVQWHLVLMTKQ